MHYKIQSMDINLAQCWHADILSRYRLHSRFSHAINWVNPDQAMMTLLSKDLPNGPNTALINVDAFDDWLLNENVVLSDLPLIMDEHAHPWQMHLPKPACIDPVISSLINQFLLENSAELYSIEIQIYQKLDELYAALLQAIRAKDYEGIIKCTQASIGLGLGLTPSGDDRLVGLLLGLSLQADVEPEIIIAIQSAIAESEDRTNEISYAMLKHAREGRFNEWLLNLGECIVENNESALYAAMTRVFSIGSRSGGDMLKGLALSLEI